jgi:enediyne biosynthesis protein E8
MCEQLAVESSTGHFGDAHGGPVVATPEFLDDVQTMTLEAFADTIVPGVKRFPEDRAIAGVCDDAGAVEAGALELLADPATGVTAGLVPLSEALNRHAGEYAERVGLAPDTGVPAFVALDYDHRAALIAELTAWGHPERDGWVLLAMFSNMAYDSAAHISTAEALANGHPGLLAMGFAKPDADGLWRFPDFSYGRELAKRHPNTTESGSPE